MSPSDPIEAEVLSIPDCPASAATLEWLRVHEVPYRLGDLTPGMRRGYGRQGYGLSPVVVLWMGEGERRVRYMTWSGHKPPMLRIASRLAEAARAS